MEISPDTQRAAAFYLNLLKNCLTRVLFPDRSLDHDLQSTRRQSLAERCEGKDWPTEAETMAGLRRLDNLEACAISVLENEVAGDLIETGAWRGGASILMRAVLKAYGDLQRRVFVADSFQGLPNPDPARYPQDGGDTHHQLAPYLGVPLEEVKGGSVSLWDSWLRPVANPLYRGIHSFRVEIPYGVDRLALQTDVGPRGNANWDWSVWSGVAFDPDRGSQR